MEDCEGGRAQEYQKIITSAVRKESFKGVNFIHTIIRNKVLTGEKPCS